MKKTVITLMLALMSATASTYAGAAAGKDGVKNIVPENIIVKQTTRFADGRTLVVYYKKQGTQCEMYSPSDTKQFAASDARKIKSTNFETAAKVEGKLLRKVTAGEAVRLAEQILDAWL